MAICCFLCGTDVSKGTLKTKRKLLHGPCCKEAVQILDLLSSENCGQALSSVCRYDTDTDTYLCHKCLKRVGDLPGLIKRANDEKSEIVQLVSNKLQLAVSRKRPLPQESNSTKHAAIEDVSACGDTSLSLPIPVPVCETSVNDVNEAHECTCMDISTPTLEFTR